MREGCLWKSPSWWVMIPLNQRRKPRFLSWAAKFFCVSEILNLFERKWSIQENQRNLWAVRPVFMTAAWEPQAEWKSNRSLDKVGGGIIQVFCNFFSFSLYESFSDVGESRVWFASKNLMHWNAFLIAQIIAKCHSFPNMYGMLWRKSTVWPGKLISSKKTPKNSHF